MIEKGLWSRLLSGFKCHVARAHDWKRATRLGYVSGQQTCRRCGATRAVTLRPPTEKTQTRSVAS